MNENSTPSVSLKDFLISLIAENEKRFNERLDSLEKIINQGNVDAKSAVKTAMEAQEKATTTAFSAAKEAVLKTEGSTEKTFDALRKEMEMRFNAFNKMIDNLSNDIARLRESRVEVTGRSDTMKNIGFAAMSIFALLIALGTMLSQIFKK